jgi:hypothetical protein
MVLDSRFEGVNAVLRDFDLHVEEVDVPLFEEDPAIGQEITFTVMLKGSAVHARFNHRVQETQPVEVNANGPARHVQRPLIRGCKIIKFHVELAGELKLQRPLHILLLASHAFPFVFRFRVRSCLPCMLLGASAPPHASDSFWTVHKAIGTEGNRGRRSSCSSTGKSNAVLSD